MGYEKLLQHKLKLVCVPCAVYADGGICLDILQNQWSPIYDVSAILTSIQVQGLDLTTLASVFVAGCYEQSYFWFKKRSRTLSDLSLWAFCSLCCVTQTPTRQQTQRLHGCTAKTGRFQLLWNRTYCHRHVWWLSIRLFEVVLSCKTIHLSILSC